MTMLALALSLFLNMALNFRLRRAPLSGMWHIVSAHVSRLPFWAQGALIVTIVNLNGDRFIINLSNKIEI